jgi:uncharacterized protein YdeI (YjbR/CyaY-like superfamily)
MAKDKRVDAYIAKAAPFAQPILEHLRALVHNAIPDADEAIKWGMPHYTHKGKNVAGMAAFKAHCSFMIHGEGRQSDENGMGSFGKIARMADLPSDVDLIAKLHGARDRVETVGRATKPSPPKPKAAIAVPQDFAAALREAPQAKAFFDTLAPGQRRDYLAWVTEAKRDETRAKRLATTIEWLGEGKRMNWKYEKC